jgi:hypothetical protein
MTPKEKAESLVNEFRILLMNEDTECGNEILCTSIAKKFALIIIDEILEECRLEKDWWWFSVKNEIEKL